MFNGTPVKHVEDLLLTQKTSRTRHGDIPYPIATYCRDLADFDIWDHMFRVDYCKSLTMHRFGEPPALTLDLGCGSGFWAMEAAKQWKNSRIIGFDIAEIQPRLSTTEHLMPLSRRVNWVHGNVLHGLPFPSNHFDFIRIVGMGLAIPEDEWQPLLEEVYRVLKQGAVLEIIEEDLIFPSPSSQLQEPQLETSSNLSMSPLIELPILPQHARLPRKRSYIFSDKSSEQTEVSSDSSVSSIAETISANSKSSLKRSSLWPGLYTLRQGSTATLTATTPSMDSYDEMEHPQDHTRLKIAWDAMLTTRFLSPRPQSILPFYLTSASFSVKLHEAVAIPLPPNSGLCPSLKSFQSMGSLHQPDRSSGIPFDFRPTFLNRPAKADSFAMRSSLSSGPRPQPQPWGSMHLAKITSVIKGCKDAIWLEYQKLYSKDALNILARTAPDDPPHPPQFSVHRAFEIDWNNWDCDMTDRIGMRKNLLLHSGWAQPTNDDQPNCQNWRDKLDGKHDSNSKHGHLVTAYNPEDLCRSIRAFTARKL